MKLTVSKKERGGVITCESGRKYIFLKQDEGQVMVVAAGLMAEDVKFDDDTTDYSKSRIRQLIEEKILPLLFSFLQPLQIPPLLIQTGHADPEVLLQGLPEYWRGVSVHQSCRYLSKQRSYRLPG